jgi:hypothetical protein
MKAHPLKEATMPAPVVEVQGTLHADGTLVLDQKPNLPPGRVRVTVQPVVDYKQTEIWRFFEKLHADMAARGHHFRTAEEIDADIAERQREEEEYDQYMERLRAEVEQGKRDAKQRGGA